MARNGRSVEDELRPLVDRFLAQVARVMERHVTQEVRRRLLDEVRERLGDGARPGRSSRRPAVTCYFPGCRNLAAPRFGMFCAALHKDLPAAQKAKHRAQHSAR